MTSFSITLRKPGLQGNKNIFCRWAMELTTQNLFSSFRSRVAMLKQCLMECTNNTKFLVELQSEGK